MYDVVIIGAGPAGLTAGIYACCFKLSHVVIGTLPGGQMTYAPDILNYPGFDEISGPDLTKRMVDQFKNRGGELIIDTVTKIDKTQDGFRVTTGEQKTFETKTIILATGVERKKLNIKGEQEYTGKGVGYCATCDRLDYEDKICAVVGGANSAAQSAMQLAKAAAHVYILMRGMEIKCDPMWLSKLQEIGNVTIIPTVVLSQINGDEQKVTSVTLASAPNGKLPTDLPNPLPVDKVFIEIGGVPGTALLLPLGMQTDEQGFIAVNDMLETSIPGIFACGDVINHKYSIEQISSSVGTGARASMSVFSHLKQQTAPSLWGKVQIKKG